MKGTKTKMKNNSNTSLIRYVTSLKEHEFESIITGK